MITVDMSGKEESTVYGLWRYDYGETIEIIDNGSDIPDGAEVEFYQGSNGIVRYIKDRKVEIPDYFLMNALDIIAYVYIRSPSSGETVKSIRMPVKNRPYPANMELPDSKGEYLRLLPDGGIAGQVLTKKSDKNFDVAWEDIEQSGEEPEAIPQELIDELFNTKGE